MTLYLLKNIRRVFGQRTVLNIPDLRLDAGKIYTLSGPNGAGKTTLLHLLGFLTFPTSGEMTFKDVPVRFNNTVSLEHLRKSVILVDQHPILFSTTVYKNVEFGLKIRKIPADQRKQRIESALDRVGMMDFIHADARYLSGGETRRVAIARALACSPDVLLLDEPTADLDIEHQLGIEKMIQQIHRQNHITIVFCTHNLPQGLRLTSHHIHLFAGEMRDSEHENIFKGDIVTISERHYCRIAEKVLIPVPPTDKKEAKISIHPDAIRMITEEDAAPAKVPLRGKVIGMAAEKDRIRAMVDVGVLISMAMKATDPDFRNVHINAMLGINIDPDGVTVF